MRNEHVNEAFRDILAGVSPKVPPPRYAMTARKDDSRLILETTASTLCATDNERHMLQMCYDIGVMDGGIKAKEEAMAKLAETKA